MKTLLIIASLFFLSCSARWHLRQAELKGATTKSDTVYATKVIPGDSVRVEIPVDRIFLHRDTVYQQGRAILRYKIVHDTLRLEAECIPDTVKIPVTVYRSITAPPCPKGQLWKGVGFGAGGVLLLLILLAASRLFR